jgi:hypothetical protein
MSLLDKAAQLGCLFYVFVMFPAFYKKSCEWYSISTSFCAFSSVISPSVRFLQH